MTDKAPRIAIEFRSPKNRELFRRIAEIAEQEGRSQAGLLRHWAEQRIAERDKQGDLLGREHIINS